MYTSPDRRVREQASSVLPLPKTAGGRPLPSICQLVRSEGDPEKGRAVFFRAGTNSCGSCHRVQGNGQWIGPDLSTIGVKYGKDELIRSILSPSAAIGFSFRSLIVALADGRVVTGLPVEETADRLVLKTAEGQRVNVPIRSIEDRKTSDVSLMPEGLAQTMTEHELVDLLAFLTTLKQPVSIVGQYQAVGPVHEPGGKPLFDSVAKLDVRRPVSDGKGRELSWRRVSANAEGQADLSPLIAGDVNHAVYVWVPIVSPVAQRARVVIDTPAEPAVWLGKREVELSGQATDLGGPRSAMVELPEGETTLVIRLAAGARSQTPASLVTTIVADRPVGFQEPVSQR